MIDSYSFGNITINGKSFISDVIIFPDHVKSNWWRREGHQLCVEDIKEVIEERPKILVVGTGRSGAMRILPETRNHLKSNDIELIEEKTDKACKIFNQISSSGKVIAALHLTC